MNKLKKALEEIDDLEIFLEKMVKKKKCKRCKGTGKNVYIDTQKQHLCKKCNGKGYTYKLNLKKEKEDFYG